MKKEVLVAVVLGVIAGLIITFGIYTANAALQKRARQGMISPTPVPSSTETPKSSIILYSPEDDLFTDKSAIQVSGLTTPNAVMVIFANDKENITTADDKGNFSFTLDLIGGSNIITVVSTDTNGKQEQMQRTVVYSTANLDEPAHATAAASPKPSPSATPKGTPKP